MINIDTTDSMQMDGTKIEKVTNYRYLGQTTVMEAEQGKKSRYEENQDGVLLKSTEKYLWTGTFP